MPYVLALRTDGTSLSSIGDDKLGGYLATRYLLDLGHRRVPFDQIAAAALELLTVGPASANDRIRVASPTLIPRRSTAPPRPHGERAR